MVLQTVVAPPPFSGNGDARWISNVGDFGGVVVVPIEQLECLLGTVIDSIVSFFLSGLISVAFYVFTNFST